MARRSWKDSVRSKPTCAVTHIAGRATAKSPFGRRGAGTVCRAWLAGDICTAYPLTRAAAEVTCPECVLALKRRGWDPDGRFCQDCTRFPREGHAPTCVFVELYGGHTRPDLHVVKP